VLRRVKVLGFRAIGKMPRWLRVFLVKRVAPSYTVGAMCLIRRDDGQRLLIRHSYRKGWGVPGGLLKRGETPIDGVRRETLEEVGLEVVFDGRPTVVVDPKARRVDVIFAARPADPTHTEVAVLSPEVVEAGWFPEDALPPLQHETQTALRLLLNP
jgi:ADP-ribose pyrophosphatase YjhB (NUDIX family)